MLIKKFDSALGFIIDLIFKIARLRPLYQFVS